MEKYVNKVSEWKRSYNTGVMKIYYSYLIKPTIFASYYTKLRTLAGQQMTS